MIGRNTSIYLSLDASLTMAPKRTIVLVGWLLLALAFASVFAVALIAIFQGGGAFGVDYRRSGRPAFFMPMLYVPLLIGAICIGAYWAWRKMRTRKTPQEASNNTPRADARTSAAPPASRPRAGGRGR